MSRWLALPIAIIAGGAIAFALVIGFTAVTYGVLWIYVFGDNSWPAWVDRSLNIVVPLFGLAAWVFAAWSIWRRLTVPRPAN